MVIARKNKVKNRLLFRFNSRLSSGNDAADRNAENWKLSASNDGSNYTQPDILSGEIFLTEFFFKKKAIFLLNSLK